MERTRRDTQTDGADRPSQSGDAGFLDDARTLGSEVTTLAQDAARTKRQLQKLLTQRISDNPYTALATAAGLGFVVAGGLSPAVLRTVTGLAGRIALAMLTKHAVELVNDGAAGDIASPE